MSGIVALMVCVLDVSQHLHCKQKCESFDRSLASLLKPYLQVIVGVIQGVVDGRSVHSDDFVLDRYIVEEEYFVERHGSVVYEVHLEMLRHKVQNLFSELFVSVQGFWFLC